MKKVINIDDVEIFNENDGTFTTIPGCRITLIHSLVSISKWESKWNKPFLDPKRNKPNEELIDYIKCMTTTQNVDERIFNYLPNKVINEIDEYINAPMTATWFNDDTKEGNNKVGGRETITSELVYYWMITLNIPVEFEKWHINRLLTLIRICNIKNTPPKKMSKREIMSRNNALNAARKAKYNTKG